MRYFQFLSCEDQIAILEITQILKTYGEEIIFRKLQIFNICYLIMNELSPIVSLAITATIDRNFSPYSSKYKEVEVLQLRDDILLLSGLGGFDIKCNNFPNFDNVETINHTFFYRSPI